MPDHAPDPLQVAMYMALAKAWHQRLIEMGYCRKEAKGTNKKPPFCLQQPLKEWSNKYQYLEDIRDIVDTRGGGKQW